MLPDHVRLDEIQEVVVAEPVGRAVGQVEVDTIVGVGPEEERLNRLGAGQHLIHVLVEDEYARLGVVPSGIVVGNIDLDERDVVRDLAGPGQARIDQRCARQRFVVSAPVVVNTVVVALLGGGAFQRESIRKAGGLGLAAGPVGPVSADRGWRQTYPVGTKKNARGQVVHFELHESYNVRQGG